MGLNAPFSASEIFLSIQREGRGPLRASGPKARHARESRAGRGTIGGWSGEPGRGAQA
jgi:hypothetical protein